MPPIIRIRQVSYTYHDGADALRDISLEIAAGEKVAVIGPNGAGKTTLLLHLNGILRPSAGTIEACGKKVEPASLAELRPKVGMVFQQADDQLFMPTVFDDVAFGPLNMGFPPDEVRRRVAEALEEVGLRGFERKAPYHLSGGEKKAIAIATVLSMSPEVLVLDEPTASLDHRARRRLIRLLQRLPQTIITATHDLRMVMEVCRRAIILDGGRVEADGPAAQILADTALLAAHGLESPCRPDVEPPGPR